MQKILLGNLIVLAILTSMPVEHNEIETNFKEETEEVDLISIFPYVY